MRPSLDADEFMNLLHGSDPVKVELNRLENEVRDKEPAIVSTLSTPLEMNMGQILILSSTRLKLLHLLLPSPSDLL